LLVYVRGKNDQQDQVENVTVIVYHTPRTIPRRSALVERVILLGLRFAGFRTAFAPLASAKIS
jgi:hypothetical protein